MMELEGCKNVKTKFKRQVSKNFKMWLIEWFQTFDKLADCKNKTQFENKYNKIPLIRQALDRTCARLSDNTNYRTVSILTSLLTADSLLPLLNLRKFWLLQCLSLKKALYTFT